MSYCKMEEFPRSTSATYIAKLLSFCTILAIAAACVSVGLAEVDTIEDPINEPILRVLSSASNFIGTTIYGMIIFFLPFGLGGMGAGYLIEQDRNMKNRTTAIGFVSGALLGYFYSTLQFPSPPLRLSLRRLAQWVDLQ